MKTDYFAKLLSGRYYLTLVAGVVFAFSVYRGLLPPEATAAILTAVIMSYFQRDRGGGA